MISKKIKIISILIISLAILTSYFFYFIYQVSHSHGNYVNIKMFNIPAGQGNLDVASYLASEKLISGKWYFYFYLRTHRLVNKILPGEYQLSGKMTIPEIAVTITQLQNRFIKITFPEGWDSQEIADRLTENGFSKDDFMALVNNPPPDLLQNYSFFSGALDTKTLEGYLFPDTYFFSGKKDVGEVLRKMLNDFDNRLTLKMRQEIKNQGKTIPEIITLASIVEKEVSSDEDRHIASGIFWKRIQIGQPLQSDATLTYILGIDKDKYSFGDSRISSPYNTYTNKGLPLGPISNPSLNSIEAAIYPTATDYLYFLSDPATHKTIFAKTFEEQSANKAKYGL